MHVIRDADTLAHALPQLLAAPVIGLDTETTGLDPHTDRLRLVQLAVPGAVYIIDCFAVDPVALEQVLRHVQRLLGHNLRFDLRFLMANGLPAPDGDRLFDTMLASQVLHAGLPQPAGTHTLAGVTERLLGIPVDKTEQRSDWTGALTDAQIAYAAKDAAILLPLAERLQAKLRTAQLERVARIEMRALPAIAWLEHTGAPFDTQAWTALAGGAAAEQLRLEQELTAASGTADLFGASSVNWGSPDQVGKLLRQRGHHLERTDEATLRSLAGQEPLAPLLLAYRDASRKASAYGTEFMTHVHPRTGRIHAGFIQIGASSGRMACTRPNLQNIPRDPAYRACFRAGAGRALVKADYSQIELRIAAQLTRDPLLLAAYREGADVHLRTAAAVLGVAPETVTRQQRQLAKALNFGLLYGMGAPRLREHAADGYGVVLSEQEAQTFRDRFFQTYAGLRRWHRGQSHQPVETRSLIGRRHTDVQRFTDKLNLPVQGTGADILKLALARLWEDRASQPSAAPVLCVHDEIVFECDAGEASAVAGWLQAHMEAAGHALLPDVPVVADLTVAADWSGTSPSSHYQ